ncbi:unnamed protein product, partial [Meganyctiphanes norvegica]
MSHDLLQVQNVFWTTVMPSLTSLSISHILTTFICNLYAQIIFCIYHEVAKIKVILSLVKSSGEEIISIFQANLAQLGVIRECDLGNRSILHAVIVKVKGKEAVKKDSQKSLPGTANINSLQNDFKKEENKTSYDKATSSNSTSGISVIEKNSTNEVSLNMEDLEVTRSQPPICPGMPGSSGENCCARLLCDASTVMTIQLTEDEQKTIKDLKASGKEGETPHFYVYCMKPCSSVRVGKLRVRCSLCKQGAITLHRDPCNWQDVLTPGQVE